MDYSQAMQIEFLQLCRSFVQSELVADPEQLLRSRSVIRRLPPGGSMIYDISS